jgi:hypothetical protein
MPKKDPGPGQKLLLPPKSLMRLKDGVRHRQVWSAEILAGTFQATFPGHYLSAISANEADHGQFGNYSGPEVGL